MKKNSKYKIVIGVVEGDTHDIGNFKVMVGGGCISQDFADKIKADGYSANAVEAVRLAKSLVGYED
ncbi:hypothetical protein [Clostridium kluyveri]|uniref:B12-binding domain-containing protein n=1 Tax=Clostridium kluyveri TaxID=1534 RepID=A0A1L5F553_CLOKL|nr:hypothetical protein [Clostridium kluyveri]APM38082.1 hypothetical protein BS101_04695 [Clostridium kluyveri]UZQ51906.1 hypothetical protein OP486_07000 [Clostridium kluyveri]